MLNAKTDVISCEGVNDFANLIYFQLQKYKAIT